MGFLVHKPFTTAIKSVCDFIVKICLWTIVWLFVQTDGRILPFKNDIPSLHFLNIAKEINLKSME